MRAWKHAGGGEAPQPPGPDEEKPKTVPSHQAVIFIYGHLSPHAAYQPWVILTRSSVAW